MNDAWIIMPVVDQPDMTEAALEDCLAQELDDRPRVLLVDNGSNPDTRRRLEIAAARSNGRILCVWHHPPLGGPPVGTLNASWNFALEFVWGLGADEALVVNNDIRMVKRTYIALQCVRAVTGALFVSAVGVREEQFQQWAPGPRDWTTEQLASAKGGPDFSCFLISKECHEKYPFDPAFTYCGDLDYHRRLMLGGDGERIFSVNWPYLHHASGTLKGMTQERRQVYEAAIGEHRRAYEKKWGGPVNQETLHAGYAVGPVRNGCVTTPDLQRHKCGGVHAEDAPAPVGSSEVPAKPWEEQVADVVRGVVPQGEDDVPF